MRDQVGLTQAVTQARTIDSESLRELAAEMGFWAATTEEADIERQRRSVTVYPPPLRGRETKHSQHFHS
jgi:hypothetical protein